MLDRMDIEQERGITIKLTPVRMQWKWYELNLIDTPGHVDFQYEVSRSLAAVEWAILLIDASQWVQAQTLSVLQQARDQHLTIIPILNKIDLPAANPAKVAAELEQLLGINPASIIHVSGKTGQNVDLVLDAIIERISDPDEFREFFVSKYYSDPTIKQHIIQTRTSRALIFDSVYDKYKWVVCYVKVVDGEFKTGLSYDLIHSDNTFQATEVWHFTPEYHKDLALTTGQIGYVVTWQKSVRDAQIWDTMMSKTVLKNVSVDSIYSDISVMNNYLVPGFKKVKPYVYAGVYPLDSIDYDNLKEAFGKLQLNDSAVEYELESSQALWFWFRAGFLGMLHMDIIKERILREYGIQTIFTIPNVIYLVKAKQFTLDVIKSGANIIDLIGTWLIKPLADYLLTHEQKLLTDEQQSFLLELLVMQELTHHSFLSTPKWFQIEIGAIFKPWIVVRSAQWLPQWQIDIILEPMAQVEVVGPEEYSGNIMDLCQEYRGMMNKMERLDHTRIIRHYLMPMGEVIVDFYDRLKSATKGYATMNYEFKEYQESDLVKMDIFLNNDLIEAFAMVIHTSKAYEKGREIVEKLKELIPKHLFSIPIQAGIGNKMIARETISALKKDVISKCYGWDITRKRKLLAKQKEGKKRMKAMWSVSVPDDIFIKMVTR